MPSLSLVEIQRQISQRDAELHELRRTLASRQNQLAALDQRKQQLQAQLQQVDAEITALSGGARPQVARPKAGRKKRAHKERRLGGGPSPGTLASLITTLVQQSATPLTATQLAREAKRHGFRSKSSDFARMVQTRVHELNRRGILQRAADQPGYVPAQGRPGAAETRRAQSKRRPARSGQPSGAGVKKSAVAKSPRPASLREVLTQILRKSTKPLTGSELAALALRAGYRSTSKSFVDVVWVAMNQIPNVENIPGQGYRLKK